MRARLCLIWQAITDQEPIANGVVIGHWSLVIAPGSGQPIPGDANTVVLTDLSPLAVDVTVISIRFIRFLAAGIRCFGFRHGLQT